MNKYKMTTITQQTLRYDLRSVLLLDKDVFKLRALLDRWNALVAPSDGAELCSDDVLRDKSVAMSRMLRVVVHCN